MTAQTLQAVQNSISNASFERNKLMIAKQAISGNGSLLYAQDVKTIMAMFSFEGTRVAFAKFAYDYTYDRQNYFQINDGFQFSSSVVELNQFLQGRN
jgi:nuclear transport factor 2 (NTF2) superfamily protein